MNKKLTIEELKGIIMNYAYDPELCQFDLDLAFDLLIKLNLLNTKAVIEIGEADEVL